MDLRAPRPRIRKAGRTSFRRDTESRRTGTLGHGWPGWAAVRQDAAASRSESRLCYARLFRRSRASAGARTAQPIEEDHPSPPASDFCIRPTSERPD